jgi:hypothetical protein
MKVSNGQSFRVEIDCGSGDDANGRLKAGAA